MSDMWILAGQSNMEGVGDLVEVEAPHDAVSLFAHGDEWRRAEEPLHWLLEANDPVHWYTGDAEQRAKDISLIRETRTKGAGLGLPFAKAIAAATGNEVDLVPTAHGGTSMEQWNPSRKGEGGGSLYGAFVRRVALARETKPDAVLRGILWYQGESDSNPDTAVIYTDRMADLIGSMRADLGDPNLPFYLVQLGCFTMQEPVDRIQELAWCHIRELQRLLPGKIANTAVIPAVDLELHDAIHIGTLGLKRLGKRMANVALKEVYGQTGASPISLESVKLDGTTITVTFGGVNGTLISPDPSGRVSGFGITTTVPSDPAGLFRARVTAPNEVTINLNNELKPEQKLWYGYGYNPFCQLTDSEDMAAPTFGPIDL